MDASETTHTASEGRERADRDRGTVTGRTVLRLFGAVLAAWWNDNVPRLGASLSYYTLFAIAPVMLVAIAIAGLVFGAEAVRGEIVGQLDELVGREGAQAVQALLAGARREDAGVVATIIGSVTFVLAATGAFLELQAALNTIWRVKPRPNVDVRAFFTDRLRSFGLVVAVGFLLLVSLAVVTTLFALVYRFLPDVHLRWRDVAMGAFVTAVLFTVGKQAIGLYLGRSSTSSSYGAAGSVIVLLLWVYYSSQIVLLGAEFTRVYAERSGVHPPPQSFAEEDPDATRKV